MTERQAFEQMMDLMEMEVLDRCFIDQGELVIYWKDENDYLDESKHKSKSFLASSYYGISAGAIFTKEGSIWKGFLHSGPSRGRNFNESLITDLHEKISKSTG